MNFNKYVFYVIKWENSHIFLFFLFLYLQPFIEAAIKYVHKLCLKQSERLQLNCNFIKDSDKLLID